MTQLRIKNSFIPWSFPELVAKEDGIFAAKGLDVTFYSLPAKAVEPGNKITWYSGLVEDGKVDAYSCCAWAALDRLSDGGKNKIVGATSSLDYAFTIFVPPTSRITKVEELAGTEIQVNLRTGSHYCNLQQLEAFIPFDQIKLVHGGAPHNRLLALLQGEAQAVALISPYTEIAREMGFRQVFQTNMVDVLAYIAKTELSESEIKVFLEGLEEAIKRVKANPSKYKPLYMRILRETLADYPEPLKSSVLAATARVEPMIKPVQWGELKPYAKETFAQIESWMTEHSLLEKPVSYEQLVNNSPLQDALAAAS